MIVEDGDSVKIHVSFTVPEAHKFDPVAVEFGFAFEKIGNEDRNFLLQGTTDLVLTFVNKGIFKSGIRTVLLEPQRFTFRFFLTRKLVEHGFIVNVVVVLRMLLR